MAPDTDGDRRFILELNQLGTLPCPGPSTNNLAFITLPCGQQIRCERLHILT